MSNIRLRTTEVTLFQGDDYDKIEQLSREVQAAAQVAAGTPARLGDDIQSEVRAKAAAYDDAVRDAAGRGQAVVVQALPRRAYRDLVVAHPPRDGDDDDKARGFNRETLGEDLVPASIPLLAAIVDPETHQVTDRRQFESEAERQAFLDALSDADFSRLYTAADKVNTGGAADPKVQLSSRLGPTSSESSEPPERLG